MKALRASMSRSGAKETTLDYQQICRAAGLAEEFGVASEIAVTLSPGRADERLALRSGAGEERAHSAAPQSPAIDEVQRTGQSVARAVEEVEPLVPALAIYSRSVEDIARENARPHRSPSRRVFRNSPFLGTQGEPDAEQPLRVSAIRSTLQATFLETSNRSQVRVTRVPRKRLSPQSTGPDQSAWRLGALSANRGFSCLRSASSGHRANFQG